jgi:L-amino acid N-acyltransferase YncA
MDALNRYPKLVSSHLELRPFVTTDEAELLAFYNRIPVGERQLFNEDVTRASVIRGWIRNTDFDRVLPIVALEGRRIVANVSLHLNRRSWSRHVAKIRMTLDPEVRGRGIGTAIIRELIDLAPALKVAILQGEILDAEVEGRRFFEKVGFQCIASLPQHAIDLSGRVHDLLLYAYTVTPPERLAPEARLSEADADVGGAG